MSSQQNDVIYFIGFETKDNAIQENSTFVIYFIYDTGLFLYLTTCFAFMNKNKNPISVVK